MKKTVVFFLVSILMPGLGYLLLGESRRLYVTLLIFYLVVSLGTILRLYPIFSGFVLILFSIGILHLGTALHAAIRESRGRSLARNGVLKWAFTTVFFLLTVTSFGNSRTVMGVDRVSMSVPVMEPEIMQGEQLLVDTWAYHSESPERGDIVIHSFHGQIGVYLNRITALGGETIEIRQGKVVINGILMDENYVRSENARRRESMNMPLTVVPVDCYFVMGDNRDRSLGDSRFNGPIRARDIRGKVTYILYSKTLTRIGKNLK